MIYIYLRPCWAGKTEESPGVYSFRVSRPRRQVVTCLFWPLARSARGPRGALRAPLGGPWGALGGAWGNGGSKFWNLPKGFKPKGSRFWSLHGFEV